MAALLLILPLDHRALLYLTLFLVLIFSGVGLPIPEEVTLLLGGYLAYLEFLSFWPTIYILVAGILAADIGGYLMGRFGGEWVYDKISHKPAAAKFFEKTKYYFERHGEKIVLFTRPLLGVRGLVPILAGHFKMNFAKFLFYDFIASVPWTFIVVSVSYYFGLGLDFITEVREVKYIVLAVAALAVLVLSAIKFRKSNNAGIV